MQPPPIYFAPPYTRYNYADNKGWSFGCPGEWGLLPVSPREKGISALDEQGDISFG